MDQTKTKSSPCSPTSNGAAHWLSGMQGLHDPGLIKPSDKLMAFNEEMPVVGSVPLSEFPNVQRFPDYIPTQRIHRCSSAHNEHPQEMIKLRSPQDNNCVSVAQASSKVIPEQINQQQHPCQDEYCNKIRGFLHDLSEGQQHPPQEQCLGSSLVASKSKQLDCSLAAAETPDQFQLSAHGTSRLMHAQDIRCTTDAHSFRVHREKPLSSPKSMVAKSKCFQNNMQQKGSIPVPASFKVETTKVHIMAERKRREKLSQRFIALSAILPNLKKMDKATILGETIKQVKHLQERLKNLEEQASEKRSLAVKPSQARDPSSDVEVSTAGGDISSQQRTIQVRINGKNVFIHMHCKKSKGMLVKLVAELENMKLSVTHTSVLTFSDMALDMTFMAQMEEGCKVTAEYIMKALNK